MVYIIGLIPLFHSSSSSSPFFLFSSFKATKDYAGLYFVASGPSGSLLLLRKKNKKRNLAAQDLWSEHNVARLTTEYRLWATKNTIKYKNNSTSTKRAVLYIGLFWKQRWTSVIRARRADLDQTGSPTWSAVGRTGGEQTGPGCPCDERRKQAHGGGELVRPPSLGGYLEAREVRVTFTRRHTRSGQTFGIASSMTKISHINPKS